MLNSTLFDSYWFQNIHRLKLTTQYRSNRLVNNKEYVWKNNKAVPVLACSTKKRTMQMSV